MSNIQKVEKLIELYGNDVLRIANMYIKNLTKVYCVICTYMRVQSQTKRLRHCTKKMPYI